LGAAVVPPVFAPREFIQILTVRVSLAGVLTLSQHEEALLDLSATALQGSPQQAVPQSVAHKQTSTQPQVAPQQQAGPQTQADAALAALDFPSDASPRKSHQSDKRSSDRPQDLSTIHDPTPDSLTLKSATRTLQAARSRFPSRDREGEDDPTRADRRLRPRHEDWSEIPARRHMSPEETCGVRMDGQRSGARSLDAGTVSDQEAGRAQIGRSALRRMVRRQSRYGERSGGGIQVEPVGGEVTSRIGTVLAGSSFLRFQSDGSF